MEATSKDDLGNSQNAEGERHHAVSFTQCTMGHHRDLQNGLAPLRRPRGRVNVIGLHLLHHDQVERSRTQYHREDERMLDASSRTNIVIYVYVYTISQYACMVYVFENACAGRHYMTHEDSTNARTSMTRSAASRTPW